MHPRLPLALALLLSCLSLQSQVVADFTLPDTICVNKPVTITNLTTGGTDFYWSFCSGNTSSNPIGSELLGAGHLSGPAYITVAQDGADCYSFVSNHFSNAVTRFYHGHSFQNDPLTSDTINVSMIKNDSAQGIQIRNDNGNWFGFLASDDILLRMNFGTSLSNNRPGRYPLGTGAMSLHGLFIFKSEDNQWYGVVSSSVGNKMYLITFGNSLTNDPVLTDITQGFSFEHPGPLSLVQEDGNYYCFVVNSVSSTLSRGNFGSSILNKPVWTNLGKVCGTDAMGIMLIRDCGQTNGFMDRFRNTGNILFRLLMPQGITGPASTQSMGNIGNLNKPQQFSEITRVRDTIYTFVCNQTSTTITRLSFITCANSSIPSSTLQDPPVYSYDSAGIYNVRLTVNEGQPNQQNICKHIVVVDHPPIPLGPDRTICQGIGGYLDAGPNCDTIRWSTGDTIRRIKITQPGTYWVMVHKFGCWGSDTVTLSVYPLIPTKLKPDTAVCQGQTYILNPGSNYKSIIWNTGDTASFLNITAGGTYWVHTLDTNNCPGADTVNITMKPRIDLNLVRDTSICDGSALILHATVPGATYEWQDGSRDSLLSVTEPGVYWVRVSRDGCAVKDTSFVSDCSSQVFFPTAFSPNGDGKNDDFHPIGPALYNFKMTVFDRWGQQVFTSTNQEIGWDGNSKGQPCPVDTYSYIVTYELADTPGTTYKLKGNVSLIR